MFTSLYTFPSTSMQEMYINYFTSVEIFSALNHLSKWNQLEELDIGWNLNFWSGSFCASKSIWQHLPKLKKLFLTSYRALTDEELKCIAMSCPKLEQLDLMGSYVTIAGLKVSHILLMYC